MRKYFVLWHFVQNFDRFNKVDRFIRVCDETRYFILFISEKYDSI